MISSGEDPYPPTSSIILLKFILPADSSREMKAGLHEDHMDSESFPALLTIISLRAAEWFYTALQNRQHKDLGEDLIFSHFPCLTSFIKEKSVNIDISPEQFKINNKTCTENMEKNSELTWLFDGLISEIAFYLFICLTTFTHLEKR